MSMVIRQPTTTQPASLVEQGRTHMRSSDWHRALAILDQCIAAGDDDAEAYGHRCVVRHKLGDRAGAIADCQQAARLYAERGQLDRQQYALNMLDRLTA